jgi:sugar O-acyltransferase (sialic acid O-acetyltransferase NeuD family)
MSKVIIFGLQDFAELAHYYLTNDSEHDVVAFCVNKEYLPARLTHRGLPIVPFEEVSTIYPPSKFSFFAPMAPKKMNKVRESVYNSIKAKGYTLISYVSTKATLFKNKIGDNCFILEDNTLQPFTKIGNNVILWSGNHIGHHGEIKDHVMFTSHVVLSGHCTVGNNCFFGVNSSIRDGLTLAEGSLIAMGACITKNTEPWTGYIGNPGKKIEGKSSDQMM